VLLSAPRARQGVLPGPHSIPLCGAQGRRDFAGPWRIASQLIPLRAITATIAGWPSTRQNAIGSEGACSDGWGRGSDLRFIRGLAS
jgi:hypothetical protein